MIYAVLNSQGECINRIKWDGIAEWQPPEGCTAIADPEHLYPVFIEPVTELDSDPLASLTNEQKAALLALLQSQVS
jgi:hypothetical protein